MRALAILPRRADDDTKGELRAKLYRAKLRSLTDGALIYLVDKTLERCDFFPSIRECLEIAGEYQPPADQSKTLKTRAAALIQRERTLRFDDAMAALQRREMPQEQIDDLPEQWKMIAVERCYLWLHPDQTFTVRTDIDAGRFTIPNHETIDEIHSRKIGSAAA